MPNYYTLAEARTDGISVDNSDDKVTEIIEQNEALLEELIGRVIYVRTETFKLDSDGSIYIRMPWKYIPLISVSALFLPISVS